MAEEAEYKFACMAALGAPVPDEKGIILHAEFKKDFDKMKNGENCDTERFQCVNVDVEGEQIPTFEPEPFGQGSQWYRFG